MKKENIPLILSIIALLFALFALWYGESVRSRIGSQQEYIYRSLRPDSVVVDIVEGELK